MQISRQGKTSAVQTDGKYAQWLAPDIAILSALLPADLPAVKMKGLDHYEKDTSYEGTPCRLLVSSGEAWLSDWGITIEDILPEEEIKRVGASNYRFLHGRAKDFV